MKLLTVHTYGEYWCEVFSKLKALGVTVDFTTSSYPEVDRPNLDRYGLKNITLLDKQALFSPQVLSARFQGVGRPTPVSGPFLEKLKETEIEFLRISDRTSFIPTTVRHRSKLYYGAVRFWKHFLESQAIDTVFFGVQPHRGYDIVLHDVAKLLGIRVVCMATTPFTAQVFFQENSRKMPEPPKTFLAEKTLEQLTEALAPEVKRTLTQGSRLIWFSRLLIDEEKDEGLGETSTSDTNETKRKVKSLARPFWPSLFRGTKETLKNFFRFGYFYSTASNGLRWFPLHNFFHQLQRLRSYQLKKAYESVSVCSDLEAPYVVFMMHVQPERTTLPDAGVFAEQVLAMELVAASLPEGWKLLVREHPRQLGTDAYNFLEPFHFRTPRDYQEILAIPRVELTSFEVPLDQLLEKAKVIATPTGSAGWEALQLGKPCIRFGNAWYSGCESAYDGSTLEGCQKAVQASLEENSSEKVNRDFLRFLAYLSTKLYPGCSDHISAQVTGMSTNELTTRTAETLSKIFTTSKV